MALSEGIKGLAILIGSATVLSLVFHRYVRSFVLASLASGVGASIILQLAEAARLGYLDRFAAVAAVFGALWGFLISVTVGSVMRFLGRKREPAPSSRAAGGR